MPRNRGLLVLLLIQFVATGYLHAILAENSEARSSANRVHLETPSLENICSFLASLYVELTPSYGCIRESPVAESSRCYTSTNLLAEYVLRSLCNNTLLADKVKAFLEEYRTDFYDYYQLLLGRSFTLPLTGVEHVNVTTINGIEVIHVKRTERVFYDYDEYANLLAYSALHHLIHGSVSSAVVDLVKMDSLFDGAGFRDKAFSGAYETYKVALAVIVFKTINHTNLAEKYTSVLLRIKPLTTLYMRDEATGELRGVGDLNVETACLVAIALHSDLPYRIRLQSRLASDESSATNNYTRDLYTLVTIVLALSITTIIVLALVTVMLVLMLKRITQKSAPSTLSQTAKPRHCSRE